MPPLSSKHRCRAIPGSGWLRVLLLGTAVLPVLTACANTERRPDLASGGSGGMAVPAGGAGAAHAGAPSGGRAGMAATPTAVEACVGYCDTHAYWLPGALCEDWSFQEMRPEFCLQPQVATCAEHCETVYESVSPACAAALPAAIDCVAPTYRSFSGPPLADCWLSECRPELFDMTKVCYGLRDSLAAARANWQTSGVNSYDLRYAASGIEIEVNVRGNGEPFVTPSNAYAWTVPALFDEVERLLELPSAAPLTLYDADLGYVTSLTLQKGCEASPIVSNVEVAPLR